MSRTRVWTAALAVAAVVATATTGVAVGATQRGEVPECGASDVSVRYHGAGAGMSHRWGRITATDTSDHACSIQGFGGLSYVGHGDGTQIGAAATRDPGSTPRTVLRPGGRAVSLVDATITAPYSRAECRPAHVDGFRVYLPDETHSVFVAHPTTGCRNPEVHLLGHQAFRPGARR